MSALLIVYGVLVVIAIARVATGAVLRAMRARRELAQRWARQAGRP